LPGGKPPLGRSGSVSPSEHPVSHLIKGVKRTVVTGDPDPDMITTAHIERGNLTLRTRMRRFTRLASGFSKKKAYLACALALHIFAYDFLTVHSTIKQTPAQASGLAESVWTWADLFAN